MAKWSLFLAIFANVLPSISSQALSADSLITKLFQSGQEDVLHDFFLVQFATKKDVVCVLSNKQQVQCQKKISHFSFDRTLFSMEISQLAYQKTSQLALLRLNRKTSWQKKFPSLNQYVERRARIGSLNAIMQEARYLRLNNSFWPVLIRAFDVVMDSNNAVSITIWADESDWPKVEKEIDSMLASFKKTRPKR